MRPAAALSIAIAAVSCSSCSRTEEPPGSTVERPTAPPALPPQASRSTGTPAASGALALRWDDPGRWRRLPPSNPMRAAEYVVPRTPGDTRDAQCTVVTFGAGGGGNLSDNVARWIGQFEPLDALPSTRKRTVNGMTVTRVELTGTYHPMSMPGTPAVGDEPGARLVGAIVQAPSGQWFFKMTGPDATVKTAAPEFDGMIDSVRAE